VRPEMRVNRVRALVAIAVQLATSHTPVSLAAESTVPSPSMQATWCWGSERRSANVPFLRITTRGAELVVETKNYMHDYFVAGTKDISVSGDRLEFSYWYEPLARWARCSLALDPSHDSMAGTCEGELSVRHWGVVPSYLWRC
jgi:hypothetical protein